MGLGRERERQLALGGDGFEMLGQQPGEVAVGAVVHMELFEFEQRGEDLADRDGGVEVR